MNIFRLSARRAFALAAVLPLLAVLFAACDIDSADSTTAVVSDNDGTIYNFSGLYMPAGTNTEFLVYPTNRQSGAKLTWLRLLQYGKVLEGYDNAGKTWDGSIATITDGNASFTLEGSTTAGATVNIAGSLRYADQSSTMDAAWIEPSFSGSIFAQATVASPATNAPTNVQIEPTSATLTTNGQTRTFTASGGTGTYSWSLSGGVGTYSPSSGPSTTVTRTNNGTGTLKVTSGTSSAQATITCP